MTRSQATRQHWRAAVAVVLVVLWSLWLPAHLAFVHHCGAKGECAVGMQIGHGHGHGMRIGHGHGHDGEGDEPHPWHPAEAHAFEGVAIAKRPVDDVPPAALTIASTAFATPPAAPIATDDCEARAVRDGRPPPTPPSRAPPAA